MDTDEYFRYGLSWSSSQQPLSRAYVHPNSGCSIILPKQEDNVYSSYKVDSYNVPGLLSSRWHYLQKNMLVRLCPHMGHTGNPSILVNSYAWGTSLNSKITKYWTYVTMQATTTVGQMGTQMVWLGYRTPSLLLLNTNQSRFLTLLAQSTSISLLPTVLTLSLELPLQSHHSFTLTLCLSFELELITCPDQALPAHTFLGLLPAPGYTKSITHWLHDRAIWLTAYKWQTSSCNLDGLFQSMMKQKEEGNHKRTKRSSVHFHNNTLSRNSQRKRKHSHCSPPPFYTLAHFTVRFRYCARSSAACK